MQAKKVIMQCAWCGEFICCKDELGVRWCSTCKPDECEPHPEGMVSHGICDPCAFALEDETE